MAPVPGDSSKHQIGTSMPQGGHPPHHSITSSASASSVGGTSILSARGLEVDGKLKFDWLDDRQIGRLLTFEYFSDVAPGFYIRVGKIRPVAHQSAAPDKLADSVVRWQSMMQRQRGKLLQAA